MAALTTIGDYLRLHGVALGERVLGQFPPLHEPADAVSPALKQLKRRPFPAQALAIMGIAKPWEEARCAAAAAAVTSSKSWPKRPRFGLIFCGHFVVEHRLPSRCGNTRLVARFNIPVSVDAPKFGSRTPSNRSVRRKGHRWRMLSSRYSKGWSS